MRRPASENEVLRLFQVLSDGDLEAPDHCVPLAYRDVSLVAGFLAARKSQVKISDA